uniref:Uncharacterized protein n=1 Tax=Arundo donax TaxID=35708 RepID=A0A0A9EZL0_ARUDO
MEQRLGSAVNWGN